MDENTELSYDTVRQLLAEVAEIKGEWAGFPCALNDMELVLEPRYPYAELAETDASVEAERKRRVLDKLDEKLGWKLVNHWYNGHSIIHVFHTREGRAKHIRMPTYGSNSMNLQINTIGAARAWDFKAENIATERLRQLVKEWPWECYMMSGSFLETSPRSNILYMFRRCRPTIAFTHDGETVKILAALCLHPIGYYLDSFAGVMVPTDDVIAHLMLMRADERRFWAKANQHHLWEPEAGC